MSQPFTETSSDGYSGIAALVVGLIAGAVGASAVAAAPTSATPAGAVMLAVAAGLVVLAVLKGLYMLEPNAAAIMQLFGRYVGTARTAGLRWRNPL